MSPSVDLSEVQHIIVDEAQNFRIEDGNWYQKAKELVGDEGMFWVFLDYYQKNHKFQDGLPPLGSQSKMKLHKVVRNSAKVMHAMRRKMDEVVAGPQTSETKHLAGMHNKMELSHSFPGTFHLKAVAPNKVLKTVNQILRLLSSQGHSPGDIAVLFPTKKHLDEDGFKIEPTFAFDSVVNMSPRMMILDTVRRFSGLERNIVILVNPSVHSFLEEKEANFLISAYSRARIHLYHVEGVPSRRPLVPLNK